MTCFSGLDVLQTAEVLRHGGLFKLRKRAVGPRLVNLIRGTNRRGLALRGGPTGLTDPRLGTIRRYLVWGMLRVPSARCHRRIGGARHQQCLHCRRSCARPPARKERQCHHTRQNGVIRPDTIPSPGGIVQVRQRPSVGAGPPSPRVVLVVLEEGSRGPCGPNDHGTYRHPSIDRCHRGDDLS